MPGHRLFGTVIAVAVGWMASGCGGSAPYVGDVGVTTDAGSVADAGSSTDSGPAV